MPWRDRIGFGAWLSVGCYLWLAHPDVMGTVLLVAVVAAMLGLSVLAMTGRARRRKPRCEKTAVRAAVFSGPK